MFLFLYYINPCLSYDFFRFVKVALKKESSELMQRLNYCNEEIWVILVRGKEVSLSTLEASIEPDRRVSKRSRKTKDGSSSSLKVSASTSLYQLKMMIWESFGVRQSILSAYCFQFCLKVGSKHMVKMVSVVWHHHSFLKASIKTFYF